MPKGLRLSKSALVLQCQTVEVNRSKPFLQALLERDAQWSNALALPQKRNWLHLLVQFISHTCDSWYWLLGLGLLWLLGSPPFKELAVFWASGMVLLAIAILVIKFLIRRPRPHGDWGEIYRSTDPHSFPSGHAARAMAIAVSAGIMPLPWLALLLILWALLVGISRIALRLHYFSDVLVGWLLGLVAGLLFVRFWPVLASLLEHYLPFLF